MDEFILTDLLYSIYDFAISKQRMSFQSCEDMDFIAYLDYLDYIFNRKKEANEYDDTDGYES